MHNLLVPKRDNLYNYSNNNCLVDKIIEITELPNELVYDFTTLSENHSFIANNIVSSNCVETPEGAKIGIVKSLAPKKRCTAKLKFGQQKIALKKGKIPPPLQFFPRM